MLITCELQLRLWKLLSETAFGIQCAIAKQRLGHFAEGAFIWLPQRLSSYH